MHSITKTLIGGLEHLQVSVSGATGASTAEEARGAIGQALSLIAEAGFENSRLIRSRLFARDAASRRIASDLRVEMLQGDLRGASSSYIDPSRLPGQSNVAIDLVAARAHAGARKIVREYAPPIAPPMFVAIGDMVYLSGCTDVSDGFAAQLANIRANVARNLEAAGAGWSNIVSVSAHVSRSVNGDDAWKRLREIFPDLADLSLSPVDGYSAPEKLIEIETTAKI